MAVQNQLFYSGITGLFVATVAGLGEFLLHFSPNAEFSGGYSYLASISDLRILIGHYLTIVTIPFYLIGYWHLGQIFITAGSHKSGWTIMLAGSYAMMISIGWLGGRMALAFTAQEMSPVNPPDLNLVLDLLLYNLGLHNEPLIYISRLILLAVSCIWFWQIIKDQTIYPRWMAFLNPFALYLVILLAFMFIPDIGIWLYPAAIHIAHMIVFALSLYYLKKTQLI
jgi:hypothetical protein